MSLFLLVNTSWCPADLGRRQSVSRRHELARNNYIFAPSPLKLIFPGNFDPNFSRRSLQQKESEDVAAARTVRSLRPCSSGLERQRAARWRRLQPRGDGEVFQAPSPFRSPIPPEVS